MFLFFYKREDSTKFNLKKNNGECLKLWGFLQKENYANTITKASKLFMKFLINLNYFDLD